MFGRKPRLRLVGERWYCFGMEICVPSDTWSNAYRLWYVLVFNTWPQLICTG
jgi:hypothetical protein